MAVASTIGMSFEAWMTATAPKTPKIARIKWANGRLLR